ncbi:MAG: T9SS type A sorting domain-containing protein [Bacteroidales bacterium]|nr:T9SS type A sorting domain-containing protein [Bacteroidales bacterium]
MKRYLILITVMLITSIGFAGIVKKTYTFGKPQITKQNAYSMLDFEGTMNAGVSGHPAIPYQAINLLLEPGQIVDFIEFMPEDEVMLDGEFDLYPMQKSRPLSVQGEYEFAKDESVYGSFESFPSDPLGHYTTEFMNGYGFAMATFSPVKYIPAEKSVSYYSKVTIWVHTIADESADEAMNNLSSSAIEKVRAVAQNPEMISNYPLSRDYASGYEILLVTDNAFVDSFNELIQVYKRRGYRTHVVSTSDIYSEMSGVDQAEKIRNYIIQEYQNNEIEHVILAGDVEYIPYRGFYCSVQSSSVYEDDAIPSDLYYSALDGSWNDDGDNLWGEIDEDDLLPEISVGRMSFSNADELNNMINKSIRYQNTPVEGELTQPLFAGENLWDDPITWGSDYLELHIGLHEDNDYTTQGMPEDYNFKKIYESEMSWSSQDLMDEVNLGRPFLYHVGHANSNTVMHLYTSDVTNENFNGANGTDHSFSVVVTHGCICGSFDTDDCIAEQMVKIDNFAAAFIGNSRYGWFNEGQTEGPSQHIHREFTDAVFGSKIFNIGSALSKAKTETSSWVNAPGQWEEGALRWCFYDCNLLGDPVMALWTTEPASVSADFDNSLSVGSTGVEVNLHSDDGDVEGLRCAVLMNNELIGYGIADSEGHATVAFFEAITDLGAAELIISGLNCKPTAFDFYDEIEKNGATQNLFKFYPNPANNQVFVESKTDEVYTVCVETIDGQLIFKREGMSGSSIQQINTSQLKSGLYLITVKTQTKIETNRLVIQ